ncbi:MAG: sigma-70 family RNA polymerase sigma factor [Bacteroidales bacterium]|nr:sigma-70 family RNA polymerase sigma factor [Bacteroidales bacterium]
MLEEQERKAITRAREGDREAMRQIYDCYSKFLTAVTSRYVPDRRDLHDVLQDGFVKIFTSLDKFEYRGEGSLRAWMRQVMVNEALRRLRDSRKTSTVEYKWDMPDAVEEDDGPPLEDVPTQVIQDMVKALPDGYRSVFNLYVFEQKSHKEIASLLGIGESTSASQLHRAKAILARKIKEYIDNRNKGKK